MGREFEIKMKATPEQLEAIRLVYGEFEAIDMETTYYDAPDGILGQKRWTLRRRMENGVSVCTLKTNLSDGGRGEWETECGEILQAIPLLIAAGAPSEIGPMTCSGVIPTCGARFRRLAKKVPAGASVVEIALDQGILLGGGKELPFSEAEVELKTGNDEDAVTFAAQLAEQFGLTEQKASKFRRALALAKEETP